MKFTQTDLAGAFVIEIEPRQDERGFFARSYCRREFEAHGLDANVAQCNISFSRRRGTLRGMHFQRPPCQEAKLVRCTAGGIFDVIVDLRAGSPTFLRHFGIELTAENRRSLYVPKDFAHGFQTLADDSEVVYQMSAFYAADAASGIRWNDPALAIDWPEPVTVISEQDSGYADVQGREDPRWAPCRLSLAVQP